jgi:hypothetical protein
LAKSEPQATPVRSTGGDELDFGTEEIAQKADRMGGHVGEVINPPRPFRSLAPSRPLIERHRVISDPLSVFSHAVRGIAPIAQTSILESGKYEFAP